MGESPEKWLNEMETEPRDVPPRHFSAFRERRSGSFVPTLAFLGDAP
jgi:hypothetical protein